MRSPAKGLLTSVPETRPTRSPISIGVPLGGGNDGRGLVGATARGVWSDLALSHLAGRQLEDPGARTYDQPLGNVQPLALMAFGPLRDVLPVSVATRVSRSSGALIEMVAASGTVALTMADN